MDQIVRALDPSAALSTRRREVVLGSSALLFVVGFVLRIAISNPNDAILSIFVLPIFILGFEYGLRAALIAATVAYALFLAWTLIDDIYVDALGYVVRGLVFYPVAVAVGAVSPRLRAAFSESRALASIVEASDDAILSHGLDGRIRSWNRGAERILRYSAEEALEMDLAALAAPEARGDFASALAGIRDGASVQGLETTAMERRGRRIEIALSMSPITDASGNPVAGSTIARDITARKRSERYLRAEHRAILQLAESDSIEAVGGAILPVVGEAGQWLCGAWWAPVDGRLRCEREWTTPALHAPVRGVKVGAECRLADAPRDLVWDAGEAPAGIPGAADATVRGLRSQLWAPVTAGGEMLGAFHLLDRRNRSRDDDLMVVMAAIVNQVGNHLRRRRAEEAAERAKQEFFALVSHELRTPLTSIIGYADLVAESESARLSEEGRGYLEVIQRNAEREMRLVGDLLLLVRIQEGTLAVDRSESANLDRLVDEAVEAARPAADKRGIAISSHLAPTPPIRADAHRIAQVVDNLLSNAIKFTPEGGRVEVRVDACNGAAAIEVEDTGPGIPADELDRLFDRLYRAPGATAARVPGLGLGLTIVKAIVEAHEGTVGVRSQEGAGSTFRVELPLEAAGR